MACSTEFEDNKLHPVMMWGGSTKEKVEMVPFNIVKEMNYTKHSWNAVNDYAYPSVPEVCGDHGVLPNILFKSRKNWLDPIVNRFLITNDTLKGIMDTRIRVVIIAVFWIEYFKLDSSCSWFDYINTLTYAFSSVLAAVSWKQSDNLAAGGAIFSSALGTFCKALAALPLPYAAAAVSVCAAQVLLLSVHYE